MLGIQASKRTPSADRILERIHLQEFADLLPSQLSGWSAILLLDETLGSLDRNLREQMQKEIKEPAQ